ncbi:MAG TPA: VOC family protein [Thermoplasmata archaeon]|nr:VOC family protein [Thermoplasmata archaeon]
MAPRKGDPIEFARTRLLVKDFAKSWHFYQDKLGLTPAKGHGAPPYGEFLTNGKPIVSIYDRKLMAKAVGLKSGRYSNSNTGRSAVIFEVKDVDGVAKRLRSKGVRLLQGPTDRPMWGLRTIHFQDPDGYLVEVYMRPRRK